MDVSLLAGIPLTLSVGPMHSPPSVPPPSSPGQNIASGSGPVRGEQPGNTPDINLVAYLQDAFVGVKITPTGPQGVTQAGPGVILFTSRQVIISGMFQGQEIYRAFTFDASQTTFAIDSTMFPGPGNYSVMLEDFVGDAAVWTPCFTEVPIGLFTGTKVNQ
jgi:hypothetical protein